MIIIILGFLSVAYSQTCLESPPTTSQGCYEDSEGWKINTGKTVTNLVLTKSNVNIYTIKDCGTGDDFWGDRVTGNVVEDWVGGTHSVGTGLVRAPVDDYWRILRSWGGSCTNGVLISEGLREQDNHCESCDSGYYLDDKECKELTVCVPGEGVTTTPSATQNRVCAPCGSGKYSDVNNIACKDVTPCSANHYQTTAATTTSNRVCTEWSTCPAGKGLLTPGSATADITCEDCSAVDKKYSLVDDRSTCADHQICSAGQYSDRSSTSDAHCIQCSAGKFSAGQNYDTSCTSWRNACASTEQESVAPSLTQNRVCVEKCSISPVGHESCHQCSSGWVKNKDKTVTNLVLTQTGNIYSPHSSTCGVITWGDTVTGNVVEDWVDGTHSVGTGLARVLVTDDFGTYHRIIEVTCTCANGTPATDCTAVEEKCASCQAGYYGTTCAACADYTYKSDTSTGGCTAQPTCPAGEKYVDSKIAERTCSACDSEKYSSTSSYATSCTAWDTCTAIQIQIDPPPTSTQNRGCANRGLCSAHNTAHCSGPVAGGVYTGALKNDASLRCAGVLCVASDKGTCCEYNQQPVITIIGGNENHDMSTTAEYTDQGATCADLENGDISSSVEVSGSVVNYRRIGRYYIHYDCKDSGNQAAVRKTRIVTIKRDTNKGTDAQEKEKVKGKRFANFDLMSVADKAKANEKIEKIFAAQEKTDQYMEKSRPEDNGVLNFNARAAENGHAAQDKLSLTDLKDVIKAVDDGFQMKYTMTEGLVTRSRTIIGRVSKKTSTEAKAEKIVRTEAAEEIEIPVTVDPDASETDVVCFGIAGMDTCCTITSAGVKNGLDAPCTFEEASSGRRLSHGACDPNTRPSGNAEKHCCFDGALLSYDAGTGTYTFSGDIDTSKFCAVAEIIETPTDIQDTYSVSICATNKLSSTGATSMTDWTQNTVCNYCTASETGCAHCAPGLGRESASIENCLACTPPDDPFNGAFDSSMCGDPSNCPTGKGVQTPATSSVDTVCEDCILDTSFSDQDDATQTCQGVSSCAVGSGVSAVATVHADVQCVACVDSWSDQDDATQTCQPIGSCGVGLGVDILATSSSNTVCEACPLEKYSSTDSETLACEVCTPVCTGNTYESQACAAGTNRVCTGWSTCPVGKGVQTPPSASANTVCVDCVAGSTYSSVDSYDSIAGACQACGTCAGGTYMSQACTASTDIGCTTCHTVANADSVTCTAGGAAGIASVVCAAGYEAAGITLVDLHCADIDECATNNGGCDSLTTCTNTDGGHTCGACPSGYSGSGETSCVDINECVTNNGGCDSLTTCTNTVGGHTCGACPSGYTGTGENPCVNIDDCTPNPCTNGACVDGVDSFTCTCTPGYSGTLCDTDIDDCTPNPCLNGGTCTDHVNSFSCACTQDWTGATCNTYLDGCNYHSYGDGNNCTPCPHPIGYTSISGSTHIGSCNHCDSFATHFQEHGCCTNSGHPFCTSASSCSTHC